MELIPIARQAISNEILGRNIANQDHPPSKFVSLGLVLILAVLILVTRLWRGTSKLSPKALDKFAELPSLPLIGASPSVLQNSHDIGKLFVTWSKIYGNRWRTKFFGRDILIVHDPDLLKILLNSSDLGHLEKDTFTYNTFIVGEARNGLLSMPAHSWAPDRKVLNSLFTFEAVKRYIGIYRRHAELLANMLVPESSNDNKRISYSDAVSIKALDIIFKILTGVPLNEMLGESGALKFYNDFEAIMDTIYTRSMRKPWLLIPFLWKFHPLRKKLDRHIHDVESAMKKMQRNHVLKPDSKFGLDLMIKSGWSESKITAQMGTLFVGGHDTISSNFILHLWMLALEPEHQAACQQEVDRVFNELKATGGELTLSCLSEMKYLERCVHESLRLFPSTAAGTGRELLSPLKIEDGVVLEPGTTWGFFPYVLHRDPNVFPDPEKFDPGRFLPENVKNRHPFAYLPFSAGPRNCLGRKAALLELTVMSAVILRHFHLSTTDKRDDIRIVFKFTLHTSKEPNVIFRRRR